MFIVQLRTELLSLTDNIIFSDKMFTSFQKPVIPLIQLSINLILFSIYFPSFWVRKNEHSSNLQQYWLNPAYTIPPPLCTKYEVLGLATIVEGIEGKEDKREMEKICCRQKSQDQKWLEGSVSKGICLLSKGSFIWMNERCMDRAGEKWSMKNERKQS